MKIILGLFLVLCTGCTAIDAVSTSVNYYCGLSPDVRTVNREAVALAVAPNRVEIECLKDG